MKQAGQQLPLGKVARGTYENHDLRIPRTHTCWNFGHCAHPLMTALKLPATCRASFSFYNTLEEADLLVNALKQSQQFFAKKGRA